MGSPALKALVGDSIGLGASFTFVVRTDDNRLSEKENRAVESRNQQNEKDYQKALGLSCDVGLPKAAGKKIKDRIKSPFLKSTKPVATVTDTLVVDVNDPGHELSGFACDRM